MMQQVAENLFSDMYQLVNTTCYGVHENLERHFLAHALVLFNFM